MTTVKEEKAEIANLQLIAMLSDDIRQKLCELTHGIMGLRDMFLRPEEADIILEAMERLQAFKTRSEAILAERYENTSKKGRST